jgi:hypothetical protein
MDDKFPQDFIKESEKTMKIGLLGTITEDNRPHISLICSLQAKGEDELIWGQFIEGISKSNVKNNPNVGFLLMSLNREYWNGRAVWKGSKTEGTDFEMFNSKPMYRYNSYFGIHTVHYMKLHNISEKKIISIPKTVLGLASTYISKPFINVIDKPILKPLSLKLINASGNPKFISFLDSEGFPVIYPVMQAVVKNTNTVLFSKHPNASIWNEIKEGSKLSLFALSLDMEDVVVSGTFKGFQTTLTGKTGVLEIERVYNSMPPKMGYIYPEEKLLPVKEF